VSVTTTLSERLRKRALQDAQCAENNRVTADLLQPQLDLFNNRNSTGWNTYAVRMAIDHRRSQERDEQWAKDLTEAAEIVDRSLAPTDHEPCHVCNGDCSAANPPVIFCPMDKPSNIIIDRRTLDVLKEVASAGLMELQDGLNDGTYEEHAIAGIHTHDITAAIETAGSALE
jgi:hypothetical protein